MSWEDLDYLIQVSKELVTLEEKTMTQVLVVWKHQKDADALPERMNFGKSFFQQFIILQKRPKGKVEEFTNMQISAHANLTFYSDRNRKHNKHL